MIASPPATLTVGLAPVVAVAGGRLHSLVLQSDGSMYAAGRSYQGAIGRRHGRFAADAHLRDRRGCLDRRRILPQCFSQLMDQCGQWGRTHGANWAMGQRRPVDAVLISGDARSVAAGYDFTLVARYGRHAMAAGANSEGQLGDGTTTDRLHFVQVASGVTKVAAGAGHSAFAKTDGSLWAMGWNDFGQRGTELLPVG